MSRRRGDVRAKAQDDDALDLSAIAVGVAWRHGWPPDRVKGAENEYRRFLYLLMHCPHQTLTPWCDDLDLFGTSTSCTPNDMRLIVSTFSDVSSTTIQRSRNGQSVRSRQSFKRYWPTIVHLDTGLPKTTHRGTGQPLHLWRPSGPCYPLKPRPGSAGSGVGCGSGGGGHGAVAPGSAASAPPARKATTARSAMAGWRRKCVFMASGLRPHFPSTDGKFTTRQAFSGLNFDECQNFEPCCISNTGARLGIGCAQEFGVPSRLPLTG